MRKKQSAYALMGLLVLVLLFTIMFGLFALPSISFQLADIYPEMSHVRFSILMYTELQLLLFAFGVIIIFRLLNIYLNNELYSPKFESLLKILIALCGIGALSLVILFIWMAKYGGPGPGLALMISAAVIVILCVGAVINLIRNIVLEAKDFKDEIDLTV